MNITNSFFYEYQKLIRTSIRNNFIDNYDHKRFGKTNLVGENHQHYLSAFLKDSQFIFKAIKTRSWKAIQNVLLIGPKAAAEVVVAEQWIKPNIHYFEWLFNHLEDQESRELLISILAYYALGYRRVKLPLNTPQYWKDRKKIENIQNGAETMETGFMGWKVYRTNLQPFGYPFELYTRGIHNQFQLQQYRCQLDTSSIEASPGDVVIDAGGCYGDTAFYFADKIGTKGIVYSFEFLSDNIDIFERNLKLNPEYAKLIILIKKPLWSVSGKTLYVEKNGPGTRVKNHPSNPSAYKIETLTIDDVVEQNNLEKLDFIKMDIEGAEFHALKGAEQSLRRFKPKLSISIYHQLQDFWQIPQWIDNLNLGYRFYIRHFTIHKEETVLFAQVKL